LVWACSTIYDGLGDKQWDACSNMAALLNGEGLVIK